MDNTLRDVNGRILMKTKKRLKEYLNNCIMKENWKKLHYTIKRVLIQMKREIAFYGQNLTMF